MAVATTHDLPTLRGYWESGDLTLGKALGLYPDEVVLRGLYQDRALAKQGLLDALHKYGCLPKRAAHTASMMAMPGSLNRGMHLSLSYTSTPPPPPPPASRPAGHLRGLRAHSPPSLRQFIPLGVGCSLDPTALLFMRVAGSRGPDSCS